MKDPIGMDEVKRQYAGLTGVRAAKWLCSYSMTNEIAERCGMLSDETEARRQELNALKLLDMNDKEKVLEFIVAHVPYEEREDVDDEHTDTMVQAFVEAILG